MNSVVQFRHLRQGAGDIAEVKIFDTPLSDSDRTSEENSLQNKYGIIPSLTLSVADGTLTLAWLDWDAN